MCFSNLNFCGRSEIGGKLFQDKLQILWPKSEVFCFLAVKLGLINAVIFALQAASYLLRDQLDQLCG